MSPLDPRRPVGRVHMTVAAGVALAVFFVLAVAFYTVAVVAPHFTVDALLAGGAVTALVASLVAYALSLDPKENTR